MCLLDVVAQQASQASSSNENILYSSRDSTCTNKEPSVAPPLSSVAIHSTETSSVSDAKPKSQNFVWKETDKDKKQQQECKTQWLHYVPLLLM